MNKEKGFTLIELLVVIAILGVIAAVVALNVGNFSTRGTVQAANTELHQAQVAIIACMTECETGTLEGFGWWEGEEGIIYAGCNTSPGANDAAHYVYGPFRASYYVNQQGEIEDAASSGVGQWGNITFCDGKWQAEPCEAS